MINKSLQTNASPEALVDGWSTGYLPSDITFLNLKTGKQIQEPSLIAVKRTPEAKNSRISNCILAAGSAALDYQDAPDVIVYSPLRYGQIADYTAAQQMFRAFLKKLGTGFALFKPVFYVHAQEHITEVEERALIDAAIQLGARRVFLYQESLPDFLRQTQNDKMTKNAYVLHIEPRD